MISPNSSTIQTCILTLSMHRITLDTTILTKNYTLETQQNLNAMISPKLINVSKFAKLTNNIFDCVTKIDFS